MLQLIHIGELFVVALVCMLCFSIFYYKWYSTLFPIIKFKIDLLLFIKLSLLYSPIQVVTNFLMILDAWHWSVNDSTKALILFSTFVPLVISQCVHVRESLAAHLAMTVGQFQISSRPFHQFEHFSYKNFVLKYVLARYSNMNITNY